jgi:DNA-directed RNA polymerase specialized sigma24 family protein
MSHANTFKFKHHNESVSLQSVPSSQVDDITLTYADIIQDPSPSLLESYIEKEEFDENLELVKDKLTKLEFSIFSQYAYNTSYKEIAKTLDVKAKTVDNALMRIRKKSQESYQSYLIAQENYGIHTNCFVSTTFVTFEREIYVGFATSSLLESNF